MADEGKKGGGKGPKPESGGLSEGVTVYVGLLKPSPDDESAYRLYLGLDMRVYLLVQKADILHRDELPADKSPFGSLGGTRIYVRLGARVTAVRTSTSTFEAGSGDEFDLDVRLGSRQGVIAAAGNQTIPDTGCGAACEGIPNFTFGPNCGFLETAFPCVATQGLCGVTQDTCVCVPTQGGKTCGVNCQVTRALTCVTRCGTCQTCQTQCGTCNTCQTCRTNCGTCNTCNTRCGQETCGPCNTHIFTECNQHTCLVC